MVILLFCIIVIVFIAIMCIPTLYCYVFLHKEWKQWEYFLKNVDKFKFSEYGLFEEIYIWGEYRAIVWRNGTCSIHKDVDCILGTFDQYHSRKLARELKMLNSED